MKLLNEIRQCRLCEEELPLSPRPILQFSSRSRVLIIGQAPGLLAHESGIPWNDKSGDRLREWLDIPKETFYDVNKVSIVPMGFCYPGKGTSGDLPPRLECRVHWLDKVLRHLTSVELKLLVGSYAISHFLGEGKIESWLRGPLVGNVLALPHPSPRNNIWLSRNPWFEKEVLPGIRSRVKETLNS